MGVSDAFSLTELPLEISYLPQTAYQATLDPDRPQPYTGSLTVIHRAAKRTRPAGATVGFPSPSQGPAGIALNTGQNLRVSPEKRDDFDPDHPSWVRCLNG